MDQVFQALVMGIVQGLTEFLPISSSGHLLLVPYLFGWDDPFIESLAFSVVLHAGTLAALLVYFRDDWRRLVPAGFATLRDRSFQGDPDRRLAWLIAVATIPAIIAALLFNDLIEDAIRQAWLVALTLVVGGVILWLADRYGPRTPSSRASRSAARPASGSRRRSRSSRACRGRASRCRRRCSRVSTARTRRGSRS